MNTNLREREYSSIGDDVYEYYQSLADKVTGGEFQDVSFLSFDSSEPPCPVGPGQFTRLKLTDSSCQITSFENSFIQLEIKTTLHIRCGRPENLTEISRVVSEDFMNFFKDIPVIFIGFKSGIHAIDHYRFYNSFHAGPLCEQSQAIYENALLSMTKSQEEITNKIQKYAIPEELDEGKMDVPGVFLTYNELCTLKTKEVTFKVNIPYDDFAPLQFFKNYPNSICGDLQLEFKINNNKNMVFYPLNVTTMIKRKLKRNPQLSNLFGDMTTYNKTVEQITNYFARAEYDGQKMFTNCGDEFEFLNLPSASAGMIETVDYLGTPVGITPGTLTLQSAKSFINCYNIPHDRHEQLRDLLSSTKIYIPGQRIDQYTFSQTPTVSSMNCNTTQSLVNCSALAFIWPRSPNELTCSVNPCLSSIQLQIDNKTYPDKPFSTTSPEHASYILSNLMFDDFFSPNKSLEKSLSTQKEYDDSTNYAFIVSLERLDSSPFVFEGLTKDNCYITLNGTFDQSITPYSKLSSRQNPIMFVCQDTLWELSAGDINYYYNDKSIIPRITNK